MNDDISCLIPPNYKKSKLRKVDGAYFFIHIINKRENRKYIWKIIQKKKKKKNVDI